jgi:hypothetical protein
MIQTRLAGPFEHGGYAIQGLQAPHEDGMRDILLIGHYIEKMVDTINEVYVGGSTFPVHHFRSQCPPAGIRMGRAVHDSIVCLYFHDPSRCPHTVELRHQHLAQQFARDLYHIRPGIERIIQFFYGYHQINILSLNVIKNTKASHFA